jgi:hypothetical protein
MKHCSVCEREFTDDNLKFCTACGGPLVTASAEPAYDPFKTMVATPRPSAAEIRADRGPVSLANEHVAPIATPIDDPIVNPTWSQIAPNVEQSAPGEIPSRGLALGAMVVGLSSVFCGVTSCLGLPAAILGFVALRKHKGDPQRYGGKNFAIVGIISGLFGALIFVALCLLLLLNAYSAWR